MIPCLFIQSLFQHNMSSCVNACYEIHGVEIDKVEFATVEWYHVLLIQCLFSQYFLRLFLRKIVLFRYRSEPNVFDVHAFSSVIT